MKRKLLCSIIIISCLLCISVPCLAYVTGTDDVNVRPYVNMIPTTNIYFNSDNENSYYYGDDNIVPNEFYIVDDTNLDYKLQSYSSAVDTPYYFTTYSFDSAIALGEYRYSSSKKCYSLYSKAVGGKYAKLVNLMPMADYFAYTDEAFATFHIIMKYYNADNILREIEIVEDVPTNDNRAYLSTWNVIYNNINSNAWNNDLEREMYLLRLDVWVIGDYNGVGSYRWLVSDTDNPYQRPTSIVGGQNVMTSVVTIDDVLETIRTVFGGIDRIMSIEILPYLTFYRLLSIAIVLPLGLKIIRSL